MSLVLYLWEGLLGFLKTFGVELLFLVALLIFGVLIAGVLAPLGALTQWAGWSGRPGRTPGPPAGATLMPPGAHPAAPAAVVAQAPDHYFVYLSGIGDIAADFLHPPELAFVQAVQEALPRTRIIHDIFAYSVANVGLTEEERLGRFWRWLHTEKTQHGRAARLGRVMINGRNLLQVTVSADQRYGPAFNYATASTIFRNLLEDGFEPGSGVPVTLFGYSGGGQVVLGSAQYLKPALGGPLQVLSLGGVMADSAGIEAADEIIHLEGARDSVQRLGDYLFPRRWPLARRSRWNQALASGKLRRVVAGPMLHNGPGGYLDPTVCIEDGRSYFEATVAMTVQFVEAFRARHGSAGV